MPVVSNRDIKDLIGKLTFHEQEDYLIQFCSEECLLKTASNNSKVVKNGQTESTFFALLDNEYLLLPIQTRAREKTHPLGEQNNKLDRYQIWKKIKEIIHPNLMEIIDVCHCTAKVKIVQGKPLLNLGTMPAWQQVYNNNGEGGLLSSEKISFQNWRNWMAGLSDGLLSLHRSGVCHGDPYPFNIIINDDKAVWVDYSHSTDDDAYRLKDIYTFVFYTCLYSIQFCDKISPSLIKEIIEAISNDCDTDSILLSLGRAFNNVRGDLVVNEEELSNTLIFDSLGSYNIVDEFFYRGTISYYQSFISWMKAGIYLRNINDIIQFKNSMKEKEVKRLMVPKGELEAEKNNFSLKVSELNSIIDSLNVEVNKLLLDNKSVLEERHILEGENQTLKNESLLLQEKIIKQENNISDFQKKYEEQEKFLSSKLIEICQDLLNAQNLRSHKVSRLTRIMKHEAKQKGIGGLLKVLKKTSAFISGKRGFFSEYNEIDPMYQITTKVQNLSSQMTSVSGYNNVEIPVDTSPELRKTKFNISNGKKRVAYFTNQLLDWFDQRPRYGGGERYCINLADLMVENGLDVDIYQIAPTEFKGEYYGYSVKALKHGEFYSEFNIDAANQFYEISLEYDHVIYNMPELSAGRMRPDAISITHGIWFDHSNYGPAFKFREKEWFKYLYKAYDNPQRIVSVDTNSINVIRAFWPELANKMKYIPNFVDHSRFTPPTNARKNNKIKILFPRRSQINRGSRILEDILNNVPYDVEFYWVGEGDPYDTELIRTLTKKDLRLHYEKDAGFDEMPKWYQECDIAVIPTIACEGTSLSCIEALASGCATICTNVGGLTDIIQDQYNGRCVDPDPLEIAKAINEMIENPEIMRKYQESGLNSSYAFSLERWRGKWKEVLKQEGWIEEEKITSSNGTVPIPSIDPNNIKVAIVTRNAYHGGVESLIKIEQDNLRATVFVTGGLNNPEGTCPFTYKYIVSYDNLVEELQSFDAIIYHWPYDWAVKAIRDSGIPSIEFVHRVDTSDCDKSVPTKVVTHSNYIADFLNKDFGIQASVIPNVVDTKRFIPTDNKPKSNTIGLITSYYTTKGIDIFLNAWSYICDKYPEYSVKIYGKGDEIEEFKKLSDDLKIEKIEFYGPTSEPEKILHEFKVYVTASRIEGLPIAVLEAMACNVPIIASDIEGHKVINELAESNGLACPIILFETENSESLSKKLDGFLSGEIKYIDFSGPEIINKLFSPDTHIEKLEANLKEISNQRKPRRTLNKIDGSINSGTHWNKQLKEGFFTKRLLDSGEVENIYTTELLSSHNEFVCYRYLIPPKCKLIACTIDTSVELYSNVFLQYDLFLGSNLLKSEGSSRYIARGNSSMCIVVDVNDTADYVDFIVRPNPNETLKLNKVNIISFA